ncbi:MAG TPA: RHS repeat domain-containing protein, partial [Thermoanaerobaculia bacterium]
DGDGTAEPHDYVLVTNAAGWLLIYDATDRAAVTQVGRIELPGPASAIAVDRLARKVYVAAGTAGIYVVSFDEPPSLSPRDADGDGIDDRVLETIAVAGEDIASLLLAPELGLVFAGGFQQGVSRVTAGGPRISLVTEDAGRWREVGALAPFGVPTGPEAGAGTPERPDLVRVRLALPGSVDASVVRVDLVSVSPGGLEIDGAGNPAQIPDLPPTTLRDLELRRQGADPAQSGYNLFLSEPVVLLADLRASVHYQETDGEKDPAVCTRCDLVAAGVYTAAQVAAGDVYPELLSGHRVAVRLPALRTPLEGVYGPFHLDAAEAEVTSVPWDLSPAVRQEPALSPSYGTGDVAPGTLLHSGEMTASATDLAIRGRGFDFAFTRTYRSQTVGGGPLGPGWDHNYRLRLRPLPNGDVEYFDGRGRRELFRRDNEGRLIAPKGHFVTLEYTSAGFVMVDAGRNLIRFDAHGQLLSIADAVKTSEATGNAMTFSHDSRGRLVRVTDTLDRNVDFEYDTDGRLTTITDFTGREFEYVYDIGGKLREFKTPAVTTIDSP